MLLDWVEDCVENGFLANAIWIVGCVAEGARNAQPLSRLKLVQQKLLEFFKTTLTNVAGCGIVLVYRSVATIFI